MSDDLVHDLVPSLCRAGCGRTWASCCGGLQFGAACCDACEGFVTHGYESTVAQVSRR